jgi:hypothetical protein
MMANPEAEIVQLFELPAVHADIFPALVERVSYLIDNDFNHLIFLLYRLDINESKLKQHLAQDPINAANIIATLIVERVKQKKESRDQFKMNTDDIPDDEKW